MGFRKSSQDVSHKTMIGETRKPGFSLILGTAGQIDELAEYLASLDTQTYDDFELIIMDQNSDERLNPILAPYKGRFELLHLRVSQGLTRAINWGQKHASYDTIGFPDDDCRYPPELLERVSGFLGEHPEIDVLCGRSIDENGMRSNGQYDPEPGAIDKFNVWRRSVKYGVFVRSESVEGVEFDGRMGPGSGTSYWAADESDYLLQLLERGATLYYDPTFTVVHPEPVSRYDESAMRRSYHYGLSMGLRFRKHRYPLFYTSRMLVYHPLKKAMASLLGGKNEEAKFHWNTCKGRVLGWLKQSPR